MSFSPFRRADLIIVSTGDELTLFDPNQGHFHTFNRTAALVWASCDGGRTPADIVRDLDLPEPHVHLAITDFASRGLLRFDTGIPVVTRRDAMRQLAAAGLLGIVALPVIGSITGADSAIAASCIPDGGLNNGLTTDCCSSRGAGIAGNTYCTCFPPSLDVAVLPNCAVCCSGTCQPGTTLCA